MVIESSKPVRSISKRMTAKLIAARRWPEQKDIEAV